MFVDLDRTQKLCHDVKETVPHFAGLCLKEQQFYTAVMDML